MSAGNMVPIKRSLVARLVRRAQREFQGLVARLLFGRGDSGDILKKQIRRHVSHWDLDNAISNSHLLVPKLITFGARRDARILAVGCCNMLEIYTFWSYGLNDVTGIDLVSHDRHILAMDMHRMRFADNSFDLLYCAGAFHCSHAPAALAGEFLRVVRDGGLIALSVPVNYVTDDIYRLDAGSLEGLEALFDGKFRETLWSHHLPVGAPENPNAPETLRAIFRISK